MSLRLRKLIDSQGVFLRQHISITGSVLGWAEHVRSWHRPQLHMDKPNKVSRKYSQEGEWGPLRIKGAEQP